MTYKMNGWSGYQSSPLKKHDGTPGSNTKTHNADGSPKSKKGVPVEPKTSGTSGKKLKEQHKSSEVVNDIGDQITWLGEDYFNEKISKSQYEAKLKILRMKEKAAIDAHKAGL